jgi:PAS domain-containing protein
MRGVNPNSTHAPPWHAARTRKTRLARSMPRRSRAWSARAASWPLAATCAAPCCCSTAWSNAQQAMERDYWRFREAETRYRNLFQTSPKRCWWSTGSDQKILEANPAASAGRAGRRCAWWVRPCPPCSSPLTENRCRLCWPLRTHGWPARRGAPAHWPRGGPGDVLGLILPPGPGSVRAGSAAPVVPTAAGGLPMAVAGGEGQRRVVGLLEAYARHSPDGLVFTDPQGRILSANRAFCDAGPAQRRRPGAGRNAGPLAGSHRRRIGRADQQPAPARIGRPVHDHLRGEYGAVLEVEISASQVGWRHTGAGLCGARCRAPPASRAR